MGFMDKIKGMINPDMEDYEDPDYIGDDDEYDYGVADTPTQNIPGSNGYAQPQQKQSGSMGINSGNLELKVVKPDKYDSATAQKIADHLLNGRTVVLNLENTQKEAARRLIDFLSGVAYSIGGYIQRVANNTFVIVPDGVNVSGEQLKEVRPQEETDLF